MTVPIALTIAGSDSSGGAGIQADLKTFSAFGAYGASVITALTAQNTHGVTAVHAPPAEFVTAQLAAVFSDLDIKAIKIGMVANAEIAEAIADALERNGSIPVVLDPVMVATSGDALLAPKAEEVIRNRLIPLSDLVTPNLAEAARLTSQPAAGNETEMRAQARTLHELGSGSVLFKGGHFEAPEAVDTLFDGTHYDRIALPWVDTKNTHGTGCTLSSAIAACLAHGASMRDAVFRAKAYLADALAHADELSIGAGNGPVHHFHELWRAIDR